MRSYQVRSRGQGATFAGVWLVLVVPFFQLGALLPRGYGDAAAAAARASNSAPLVSWANHNIVMVIIFSLIEIIPLVFVLRMPALLRGVIFAEPEQGRVGQWCGIAGLTIISLVTLVNLVLLTAAASQYTAANATALGSSFRFTSIAESMIANIGGGVLLAIWLVSANAPLVRIGGLERIVGILGIISAALFAGVAGLILFNPQQSQGAIAGTSMALFGAWLFIMGLLLIRRAPALGEEIDAPATEEPTGAVAADA
ncbi:MAG: hypothetical protein H0X24_15080 [Ktedonobacterales bacterium]|nr:hypothetical protein [Ktedonobacterales bacterium]